MEEGEDNILQSQRDILKYSHDGHRDWAYDLD